MNKIVFDADFISAFLKVSQLGIPIILYKQKIIIPQIVMDELHNKHDSSFDEALTNLVKSKLVEVKDIDFGTKESELYLQMTQNPDAGYSAIDKGEAAAISIAVALDATLASNNLKDVNQYVKKFDLQHLTTGMAIHEAVLKKIITHAEANRIWTDMVAKRSSLGAKTYDEYVKNKGFEIIY